MPGPAAGHGPGVDPELAARAAQALEAGLNPATTGGAEAALRALEAAPGFPSALLALALAEPGGAPGPAVPAPSEGARGLASVQLKNFVARRWRSRPGAAVPPVPEAEKAALRGALVEGLAGARGSDLVARQVAIALAKVARCDWPAQWPDLFEAFVARLNQALAAGRPEAALRLLRGLHHALKELASKRLAADKRSFHALAGQLLPVLQGAWVGAAQEVAGLAEGLAAPGAAAAAQAGAAGAVEQLRRALQALLFCTKGLGRLLVYGHEPDARTGARVEAVVELLPQLFQAVVMLQPLAASPHLPGHEVAGRIQTKVLKIAVDVVEHHPWSFGTGPVLAPVLDFCEGLVRNEAGQFPEALIIQSMHLLHAVLKCGAYRSAPTSDLDGAAFTARLGWFREAAQVLQGFFSAAKVVALDDLVVHKYLRLSPEELEDWAAAAEAFHHACDTGGHKERARPSAETLHVALVEAKPDVLGPHLVQAFDAACAECPGEACNGAAEVEGRLLAKAALYSAVALVENDLHDSFDLVGFLHSQLAVEFRGKSGPGRIVRRQGLLLVAAWVGKVSKAADRELLYGLVLELLADADAAVRLAACACLRALVDDWNFREEPFERFQAAALERLVAFLRQAETCDTKLQVFSLVALIISRMGTRIAPCFEGLVSVLPVVWQENAGETLLRIQVVVAMQQLVTALGRDSVQAYGFLLPLLQYAADPQGPEAAAMFEDALMLWGAALRHAPDDREEVLAFFPYLVTHGLASTEHLPLVMQILQSHVYLGGARLLRAHAQPLAALLAHVVDSVNERGIAATAPALELMLQTDAGLTATILEVCLQKLFAKLVDPEGDHLAQVAIVNVFNRLCVQDRACLVALLAKWADGGGAAGGPQPLQQRPSPPQPDPLEAYVQALLRLSSGIASLSKQKLAALALCSMLESRQAAVLRHLAAVLQEIHRIWSHGEKRLHDALGGDYGPQADDVHDYGYVDYEVIDCTGAGGGGADPCETGRCTRVWQQDRVNRFSIKASAAGVVAALLAAAEPVPSALRALPQPVQAAVQEMLQGAAGPSAAVAT